MAQLTGLKSLFASKTAITGFLLSIFGILGLLGILPAGLDAPAIVNAIVAGGGALVVLFRNFATQRTSLTGSVTE
jgi:hypothetical protein